MKAMGIEYSRPEAEENFEGEVTEGIIKELDILSDKVNSSFERWIQTFPPPLAEEITYPLNFIKEEKNALRRYTKDFLENNQHVVEKNAKRDGIREALSRLRENWPITKGNMKATAQLVLDEAESNRSCSKSRLHSCSVDSSLTSDTTAMSGHESLVEDEPENQPEDEGDGGHHDPSGEPSSSKRLLFINFDDDDNDENGSLQVKARRTERGGPSPSRGRGRGRGSDRHSSPSKQGTETSPMSIDENKG
jgi:hypothetical protein